MSAAQEEQALYDQQEIRSLRERVADIEEQFVALGLELINEKALSERAIKVLTQACEKLDCYWDDDLEVTEYTCSEGSEAREYEHGTYHGRLALARELEVIMKEQEDE